MKKAILFLIIFISLNLSAQANSDFVHKTQELDTAAIKKNIQTIQYNLGKYYKQRQKALGFDIASSVVFTATILYDNKYNPEFAPFGYVISGACGILGTVLYIDAEKYLKKASISISPLGLKVNF